MKFVKWIALLLAAVLTLGGPMQVLADAKPLYLSDVMVGMGVSPEEAKQALTDAGYTVLDFNLNKGAGSAFKTLSFVYLGYKTTSDPLDAITDLSVMNMNGGYSFSDYAALMDKYRDSQIRPFVDSFLASIREYRDNYNSDNDANRAKAEYAYTVLSRIVNEDCGSNMGELLLHPTKEELGLSDDAYKALSAEEKKTTVDLTTALMQGNTEVVFLLEQMLAMASDTNETTWLQRLSELGPEGLAQRYAEAGVRPADANREMASLYNDTARALLAGWEDARTALLDYETQLAAEGGEAGTVDADPADVAEQLQIGVGDVEAKEVDVANPGDMVDMIHRNLEASAAIAEDAAENRSAALYAALKATPYGEGTMYDFFTLPYAEVSGENISALYPMVSTLTEGQIAAIDFLPLELMLQIGATDCDSYMDCGLENTDLLEVVENAEQVSIFVNVNREIFGKTTALTSEALRKQTLSGKGWTDPDSDLLGLSRLTALSWAATGVSLALTLASALKLSGSQNVLDSIERARFVISEFVADTMNSFRGITFQGADFAKLGLDFSPQTVLDDLMKYTSFGVERVKNGFRIGYSFNYDQFNQMSAYAGNLFEVAGPGAGNAANAYSLSDLSILEFQDRIRDLDPDDVVLTGLPDDSVDYADLIDDGFTPGLNEYITTANKRITLEFDEGVAEKLNIDAIDDANGLQNHLAEDAVTAKNSVSKWGKLRTAGMVITALLAIGSIILTAYDLYRYYNVNYTPIPQYIVDEADITTLDENGNLLVTRNDTAYYTVAPTNRPENHEQYTALQDYADLNGDVGKEWLALYSAKQAGGAPILANSLRVVTGSTSIPEGYTRGVHMFGSRAAANLTDSRYTYGDDLNGIYLYYQTQAPTAAASVFSGGALAIVGAGSAAAGAALGAAGAALLRRRKTAPAV